MSQYGEWSAGNAADPTLNTAGVDSRYASILGGIEPTTHFVIDTSRNGLGPVGSTRRACTRRTRTGATRPDRGLGAAPDDRDRRRRSSTPTCGSRCPASPTASAIAARAGRSTPSAAWRIRRPASGSSSRRASSSRSRTRRSQPLDCHVGRRHEGRQGLRRGAHRRATAAPRRSTRGPCRGRSTATRRSRRSSAARSRRTARGHGHGAEAAQACAPARRPRSSSPARAPRRPWLFRLNGRPARPDLLATRRRRPGVAPPPLSAARAGCAASRA